MRSDTCKRIVFADVCWYTDIMKTQAHLLGTKHPELEPGMKQAPHHAIHASHCRSFWSPNFSHKKSYKFSVGDVLFDDFVLFFQTPQRVFRTPKKNMTNQYESPSPGIRWSHSPFLRTSISQCLGGHVPGRDGDSPPFKHLLVEMVDSGDGEPPGLGGG